MGIFDRFSLFNKGKEVSLSNELDNNEGVNRKSRKISKKVMEQQLHRFQNSISLWKIAIDDFENVQFPTNEELIRVDNDAVLDAHLSAIIGVRKDKTLSKEFKLVDKNLNEDLEATKLIQTQWFRDCVSFALDSVFYGYSLIQFGNLKGTKF